MSTARILHPVVLSEFCKMSASPTKSRTFPCSRQLNRIKRDLFGHSNSAETERMFAEELEKHQERANKKWGFDFRNGLPLNNNSQFVWERVSYPKSVYVPTVYTLTRAAHVRPTKSPPTEYELLLDARADRENNPAIFSETDSCDESQDDELVNMFKVPQAVVNRSGSTTANATSHLSRKRQPKITEYMKERKRLAQTPKKVSPAKRVRTNSGSSSSNNACYATTSSFNFSRSISAHFSERSQRK